MDNNATSTRNKIIIPHNRPMVNEDDARAAYDAVLSGWLACGEQCRELEDFLNRLIFDQDAGAVVCSSGTAALFLALKALSIGPGDEVIIPDYVCTAVLNAVNMTGAVPVIADINPDNLSFTANEIQKHKTENTRAIIAMHTYGLSCEINDIKRFAVPIIEDCATSLGSKFTDGTQPGSKGDIAVFSFYATKMITGGYGGAVLSRNNDIIAKARDYIHFDCPEKYYPRFNFLFSDINAAVALNQARQIDQFVSRRQAIAKYYRSAVSNKSYLKYAPDSNDFNYYRFLLNFETEKERNECRHYLAENGITAIVPLEKNELLHNYLDLNKDLYPVSEWAADHLLSLPVFPGLYDDEVAYVTDILDRRSF